MNLFEYIKSQLPQMPNAAIMKQLGASDELIKYVKETPWNTNLGMMETYGCESESDKGEVWFTGTIDTSQECSSSGMRVVYPATITEIADVNALLSNPTDYNLTMNSNVLAYHNQEGNSHYWMKSESEEIGLIYDAGTWGFQVPCEWTGEVSTIVTHK